MEFRISADLPRIPHKKHWQFCVGSGHALLALRTDYVKQLKFIRETLGIERVRFHGIFDDDMRTLCSLSELFPAPGAENFTEENFRACGLAYDNVLDAGMKPLVELSFMPKKMSRNQVDGVFYYRPCIDTPADHAAWAAYIQRFIRFLFHRYGAEEVRSWLFEVWNEPDLPVVFFSEDREAYFKLYETTARAIKAVDPADLETNLKALTKDNILGEIQRNGIFKLRYGLMIDGKSTPVTLRATTVREPDGEKILIGIRLR